MYIDSMTREIPEPEPDPDLSDLHSILILPPVAECGNSHISSRIFRENRGITLSQDLIFFSAQNRRIWNLKSKIV